MIRVYTVCHSITIIDTPKQNFIYISGAGSDKNRALPDTSIKLCRTTYRYELFAKCFLANQKSPYFQNGGPDFRMAAKIYYNVQKLIHLTHSDGSF